VLIRLARSSRLVPLLSARHEARGAPPHHGGPFCSCDHSEGNLTLSRYHRLGVIQRFNILCDRSQLSI
jgi:hypothetical protein